MVKIELVPSVSNKSFQADCLPRQNLQSKFSDPILVHQFEKRLTEALKFLSGQEST